MKQPSSSPEFDLSQNDSGLRLMFYAGMVKDRASNPYPAGRNFYGSTSLRWQGAAGLVNRYYSNYVNWKMLTRFEEREIRFNVADMLSIDVSDKLFIDYQKYLVESVVFSVNDAGVRPAKVRVWKY